MQTNPTLGGKKKSAFYVTDKACFSAKRQGNWKQTLTLFLRDKCPEVIKRANKTISRIIWDEELYCSSVHQQSVAIRNSPSSAPFSSLPGSLETCYLYSLYLNRRITHSLLKKSFWCTGTKVQVPYYDTTGKLFSYITKLHLPSPPQKKAMTPSSSDLVSQERVYLLVIILQSKSIPSSARQAESLHLCSNLSTTRSDVQTARVRTEPAHSEVPVTAPSPEPHSSSARTHALSCTHPPNQANKPPCTLNQLRQ